MIHLTAQYNSYNVQVAMLKCAKLLQTLLIVPEAGVTSDLDWHVQEASSVEGILKCCSTSWSPSLAQEQA